MFQHLIANTYGSGKLFQIKWVHLQFAHITHWNAAQVFQFNSQKRATHDITVTSFIDEELDGCHHLVTLLNLVEENEGFARNQLLASESRDTHQYFFCTFRMTEQFHRIGLFNEIDFNHLFKDLFSNFTNGKSLAHLSCSSDQ